ncbi:TIGR02206 family membrane protein [Mobilicoccus sp.]|uniref:YwaF family protein n=1 Tax=Mobilicoccus sp. TaxID=2034349 RepID=UPI0028A2DAA6|nr:TIGR02206 family membrane protein [Mobilicoccus sp.]
MQSPEIGHMENYGASHLTVLALTVVAVIVLVRAARGRHGETVTTAFGWVLLVVAVLWMVWWWLPGNFDVGQSLPFHLSDWLRIIAPLALVTRRGWAIVLSYFWGLTFNLQALLTPDLVYFRYPALEFAGYWFLHASVFVVPVVLMWGLGYRPTWRGWAFGWAATIGWVGVALGVNALLGTNYGFVSEPPGNPSLLDLFGPWPWYVVTVALLIGPVYALLTWPWATRRTLAGTVPLTGGLARRRDSARPGGA